MHPSHEVFMMARGNVCFCLLATERPLILLMRNDANEMQRDLAHPSLGFSGYLPTNTE